MVIIFLPLSCHSKVFCLLCPPTDRIVDEWNLNVVLVSSSSTHISPSASSVIPSNTLFRYLANGDSLYDKDGIQPRDPRKQNPKIEMMTPKVGSG
jgi:hypothetical protein